MNPRAAGENLGPCTVYMFEERCHGISQRAGAARTCSRLREPAEGLPPSDIYREEHVSNALESRKARVIAERVLKAPHVEFGEKLAVESPSSPTLTGLV